MNLRNDIGMALYRGAEARAIDAAAIAAGLSGFALMQRAGAAAFASLRRHWPQARCIAGPADEGSARQL